MTTVFRFTKGHGTGNDFIVYSDPKGEQPLTPRQIAWLCDRRKGVGADGLIRAVKSENLSEGAAALAEDEHAEWFMDYYNADGTIAEMCGNGIRVYVAYLLRNGLVPLSQGTTIAVGTRAGVRDVQRAESGFHVDLGRWQLDERGYEVSATSFVGPREGTGISLGNPHIVVQLAHDHELSDLDLATAPIVVPAPVSGANVEFVTHDDPLVKDAVGRIRMRVHERGSGETQSCGTGAVAAALAVRNRMGAGAPNQWRVDVPGGTLGVRMFPTEEGEHVALSGPAELVFRGEVNIPESV